MPEHYTKNTVEATIFCPVCMKFTAWRIAGGLRSYCIACFELDRATDAAAAEVEAKRGPVATQGSLF